MKERRSLIEGIQIDPEQRRIEEEFVFGAKRRPDPVVVVDPEPSQAEVPLATVSEAPVANQIDRSILPQMSGRVPVTTRCRPEVASALKRASLQRQLAGAEPYYVQDIMEKALEEWLGAKGYI